MRSPHGHHVATSHPTGTSLVAGAAPVAAADGGRRSWLPRRLRPPALLRLTRRPALGLGWGGDDAGLSCAAVDAAAPATVRSTAVAASPASDAVVVVARADAPPYLHRTGILSGYRLGGSALSAFPALFTAHNEAGNVWTMLGGVALATALYWSAATSVAAAAPGSLPPLAAALPCGPLLPFRLLYGAVAAHNPASVGLHLWIGRGEGFRRVWRSADVALIQVASVALAVALAMPLVAEVGGVTGQAGPGGWAWWWWAWLFAVGALFVFNVASTMVLRRVWTISKARLTRDMAVLVACYLAPLVAHAAWWAGGGAAAPRGVGEVVLPSAAAAREAAGCGLAAAAAVGVGGLLYAKHWPELWAPGRFDILGHSHQWMHVGAFVAHYFQWRFLSALLLPRAGGGD